MPKYLPGLFIVLTVFFTFDCFNKVLSWLGFKVYQFSVDTNCAVTVEGRKMLEDEKAVLLDELNGREEAEESLETRSSISARLIDNNDSPRRYSQAKAEPSSGSSRFIDNTDTSSRRYSQARAKS